MLRYICSKEEVVRGAEFGGWNIKEVFSSRGGKTVLLCCTSCETLRETTCFKFRAALINCPCQRKMMDHHGASARHYCEYSVHRDMLYKCTKPTYGAYNYYGALGIKVCDRWKNSFELFLSDMGLRPDRSYTLDRIDDKGDFTPDNTRWVARQKKTKIRLCPSVKRKRVRLMS